MPVDQNHLLYTLHHTAMSGCGLFSAPGHLGWDQLDLIVFRIKLKSFGMRYELSIKLNQAEFSFWFNPRQRGRSVKKQPMRCWVPSVEGSAHLQMTGKSQNILPHCMEVTCLKVFVRYWNAFTHITYLLIHTYSVNLCARMYKTLYILIWHVHLRNTHACIYTAVSFTHTCEMLPCIEVKHVYVSIWNTHALWPQRHLRR